MSYPDIKIRNNIILENIEYGKYGYLGGYITCILVDYRTKPNWSYETLFRVHDSKNGDDYKLVSVDYGWKLKDDSIIKEAEQKLIEFAKSLNVDFAELERIQNKYNLMEV